MEVQQARSITVPFLKKEQVASDAWTFYFDKAKDPFMHYPGQYIRLIVPHDNADDRGTSRFFTISSSPLAPYFTVTTKIIQSTFKKALFSLQPGDTITCFGSLGNFYLHDNESKPLVFLASGMGITPFYSMISYIAAKQLPLNITLLAVFPHPSQVVFYDELTNIAKERNNIKVIYAVAQPDTTGQIWQGEIGTISEGFVRMHIPEIMVPKYFVVGPQAMVEDTKELLIRMSIPSEQIIIENFTGY